MKPAIPEPLKKEHEELHAELLQALHSGGKTAEAAEKVAQALHAHFLKEEEFALPPLGSLSLLARGEAGPELKSVLPVTERLAAELPEMLREHQAIMAALKELSAAAREEKKPEHARFAEKLTLHARTEEEVLYPAAILAGEYLKLKLESGCDEKFLFSRFSDARTRSRRAREGIKQKRARALSSSGPF